MNEQIEKERSDQKVLERDIQNKKKNSKRRQQVKRQIFLLVTSALVIVVLIFCIVCGGTKKGPEAVKTQASGKVKRSRQETMEERLSRVRRQAKEQGYPEKVIELLSKNEETVSFVEHYGQRKDLPPSQTITELEAGKIPMLFQWDERWGYASYGTGCVATSGCGPTCMSMVLSALTENPAVTPAVMASYGEQNGYLDEENNTYWKFMSEAPLAWGITSFQITADEATVARELQSGHPVILSVGPGYFTDGGHFIVLTGYENGRVTVHDPFSRKNSEKQWVYAEISGQVKAAWSYART